MSAHQALLALQNPAGIFMTVVGGIIFLLWMWRVFLSTLSFTTKELERPRNRRAVRGTASTFQWIKDWIWSSMIAKPKVDRSSPFNIRAMYWVEAAIDCFFVAWFILYGISVWTLALISMLQKSLTVSAWTGHVAVMVIAAWLIFGIAPFFRQRALDIRNAMTT